MEENDLLKKVSMLVAAAMLAGVCLIGQGMVKPYVSYASGGKIALTTAMVVNEGGNGDAGMLVDEQTAAGDPKNGAGGNPTTKWFPGWNSSSYPASAYIDLGQPYDITDIYLYDANGINNFIVEAGSPDVWTHLFTDELKQYNSWKAHPVSVQTRYIRVTMTGATANVAEIVLYGNPAGGAGDTIAPADIADLSAVPLTAGSVALSWTAPGDDGTSGTADAYDVRYSTSAITSANWTLALQAVGEPAPQAAGSAESFAVTGLLPNTTYYFAVKTKDEAGNESGLSNVVSASTASSPVSAKLSLAGATIIDMIGTGSASALFDEQSAAGDPRAGSGGSPATPWAPGYTSWFYPADAVIDLGVGHVITDIYLYDANNSGSFKVESWENGQWTELFTDNMGSYNAWKRHTVNTQTRYLRVTMITAGAIAKEMVVYGYALGTPIVPNPVPHVPTVTMDKLIGINAFVDDPLDKMQVAGTVREYHNWIWDAGGGPAYPDTDHKFNPSYAGGGWNFDAYYDTLNDAEIDVFPALKENVYWISNGAFHREGKPVFAGEDPEDPLSYAERGDYMYQFAARYGSTGVPASNLKLASGQQPLTGLGLIEYFENWNEQDKTWEGRSGYFKPFEYAAMASASYDGHMGALSGTHGLKNADPNAKMVMGGLAGIDLDYIRGIKLWSDLNRGGDVPFDVINVHTYARGSNGGISPEQFNLKGRLAELVDYRNRYMPGKEVWLSEFGYDTNPGSPQRAPAIGSFSAEEVQGQWLVRSFLEIAAAGVDRATMYMLRDVDGELATQYSSSGLVTKYGEWTPKTSWYYVYTLKNALSGMTFLGEQASGNANVKVYKFKNAAGGGAYVVWAPTSSQTTVNNYELTLQGRPGNATKIEMADGDTDGVSSALTISGGKVSVNVSERPIFIQVDSIQ
ncbi:hypothetical protein DQG13_02645 [Paenibacillus sp. YN15]|nr:hypothetical protein DQG13_02645 [Paenibacillus sp. YN15]